MLSTLLLLAQSSYAFQQLAPLFVLLGFPALVFLARARWGALRALAQMVLDALGVGFLWNWSNWNGTGAGEEGGEKEAGGRSGKKRKAVRTKREQMMKANGSAVHSETGTGSDDDGLYYPGLVNISGTYCFLNSVLQAAASLAYLQPYMVTVQAKAVELDVPTPVLDSLQETLKTLNTPKSSPSSIRPVPIINALSQPMPGNGKRSKLFASREHQDAQELFQLLSECLKAEAVAVEREGLRDYGLGAYARHSGQPGGSAAAAAALPESPFDGLTANRRSCVECGYTEAVMHFAFDTWTLSLPRGAATCALADCLADDIRLEVLTDCVCRRCSMLATQKRLRAEAERMAEAAGEEGAELSPSKKKRVREARKLETRVRAAIEEGRIEEDIKGVKMEKVFSRVSTKQAMIARPPKDLVLHLNRSMYNGSYAGRNSCRVVFPEILDLTPYTTSGQLSTLPSTPISTPPPPIPRSRTPTQSVYATPHVLYRLSAVVCHYGMHSFGHYVCYRRKPRPPRSGGTAELVPPQMACPYGCECDRCLLFGPVRDPASPPRRGSGRGWLRCSDDAVTECDVGEVLAQSSGAFLLFYERAAAPAHAPVYLARTPRSSEETVRPAVAEGEEEGMSGSWGSSGSGSSLLSESGVLVRPRVVRRAMGGRSRGRESEASFTRATGDELGFELGKGVGGGEAGMPTAGASDAPLEEDASPPSTSRSSTSSAAEAFAEHGSSMNGHAQPRFDDASSDALSLSLSESIVKVGLDADLDLDLDLDLGAPPLPSTSERAPARTRTAAHERWGADGAIRAIPAKEPGTEGHANGNTKNENEVIEIEVDSELVEGESDSDAATHLPVAAAAALSPRRPEAEPPSSLRALPAHRSDNSPPHARAAQARIQAPQPVHAAHAHRAPLELGLRA